MSKIRCCIKRPDSEFYITNVSDNERNLQNIVGGKFEVVYVLDDLAVICNEFAQINEMEQSCNLMGNEFYGTVIICGTDAEGNLLGLPEKIKPKNIRGLTE